MLLIEDCAHSLGAVVNGNQPVGSFGDAAFFSFGRDKIISSVFGGAAIVHQPSRFPSLDKLYKEIKQPSAKWTLQQLLHPLAFSLILPLYRLQMGKVLLVALQKLSLLSLPYEKIEYSGKKPAVYPQKLPPALAELALNQLAKLEKYNQKRKKIARIYGKTISGAVYLRYPLLVDQAEKLYKKARKKKILFLADGMLILLIPRRLSWNLFTMEKEAVRRRKRQLKKIINLPTYPRMTPAEAEKVKNMVENFIKKE